jgi:hypothetical protein
MIDIDTLTVKIGVRKEQTNMIKNVVLAVAAVVVVAGAGVLSVQHYRHYQAVRAAAAQAAKAQAAAQDKAQAAQKQQAVAEFERVYANCNVGDAAWKALPAVVRAHVGAEPNCALSQPVENLLK